MTNFVWFIISDDNNLPDGTFPIFLSQNTQEKFECISEWDLSILEPQKIIPIEKIREDLKDADSDFAPLADHIKVSICMDERIDSWCLLKRRIC